MRSKILDFCKEKNILLDVFLLDLFVELDDFEKNKLLIEKIKNNLNKRFISKKLIYDNFIFFENSVSNIFNDDRKNIIYKKFEIEKKGKNNENEKISSSIEIKSRLVELGKKLNVSDFVLHFKNRYLKLSEKIQNNYSLSNLMSINKISDVRQVVSLIGMVYEKKRTKNNNFILEIEDISGKINLIVKSDKIDLIKKCEDITLDSVLGFKGVSSGDVVYVDEIYFPEVKMNNVKESEKNEFIAFIGDLHYGSNKFMKKSFEKFINFLNNEEEGRKISHLFIVGDLVTGIGNYPNQEKDLVINNLEEQFEKLAKLLEKIRKDLKIIISPGNHDCVRIMEPQPLLNKKYAKSLYNLKNVIFVENPSIINIGKKEDFPGFDILSYHGFSYPYYANNIPKLIESDSINNPEKIMEYILKNSHLAPSHGSNQYFPSENDSLIIRDAPDIFVSGHLHKSSVSYKNNILIISVSTWEGMTSYQEKLGNKPDHCKVPVVNLKNKEVEILDFELDEGIKTYGN